MSAATRTIHEAPEMRQLGIAVGALILAATVLAALALGQQTAGQAQTAPVAGSAPVMHDHGWSSLSEPTVSSNAFDKAHAPAAAATGDLKVSSANGGLVYTGIPYPAPAEDGTGGSNGTRFPR